MHAITNVLTHYVYPCRLLMDVFHICACIHIYTLPVCSALTTSLGENLTEGVIESLLASQL